MRNIDSKSIIIRDTEFGDELGEGLSILKIKSIGLE